MCKRVQDCRNGQIFLEIDVDICSGSGQNAIVCCNVERSQYKKSYLSKLYSKNLLHINTYLLVK